MLFDYYEILILSLIQGVSEFIPVSSSAHLYIISELFDFKNQSLMIDVGMHLGSLLAVLFYFRQDFLNILKNKQIIYFTKMKLFLTLVKHSVNVKNYLKN